MSTDEARRVSGGGQPIIDGWIIPEDLSLTFANGKQQPVDVIVGFNKDDLVLSTSPNPRARNVMAWHMRLFAEKQTQIGKKAFFYTFTHEGPLEPGAPRQGAAHASEIAYVFQTLDKPRIIPDRTSPKLAMESAKDIEVADMISSYWVNFAKNGDPNGKGLPQWPVFKDRNAPPHVIGDIKEYPSAEVLNAFDAEYATQMATLTLPSRAGFVTSRQPRSWQLPNHRGQDPSGPGLTPSQPSDRNYELLTRRAGERTWFSAGEMMRRAVVSPWPCRTGRLQWRDRVLFAAPVAALCPVDQRLLAGPPGLTTC